MSTADIVLINPPVYRYGHEAVPPGDLDSIFEVVPPLGLCYLASACRDEGLHPVIIDMEATRMTSARLQHELKRMSPSFVGFTVTSPLLPTVIELAEMIKELDRTTSIVVGGAHASCSPGDFYARPEIDYVIRGDGEHALPRLLLAQKDTESSMDSIPNLSYRTTDGSFSENPEEMISSLDSLSFPARDLLDNTLYYNLFSTRNPATGIVVSRGCPFNCLFCKPLFSRVRARSATNVIKEIQSVITTFGIRNFDFFDETFNLKSTWVTEFCNILQSKSIDISWRARCRPDFITREMAREMAEAGCHTISLGIESIDPSMLIYYKKDYTPAHIRNAVRSIQAAGIKVHGYFLLGGPEESKQSRQRTVHFACRNNLEYSSFYVLNPLPGTALADENECFVDDLTNLEDIRGFHNPMIQSLLYPGEQITRERKRALLRFYCRPRQITLLLVSLFRLLIQSRGFRNACRLLLRQQFTRKNKLNQP